MKKHNHAEPGKRLFAVLAAILFIFILTFTPAAAFAASDRTDPQTAAGPSRPPGRTDEESRKYFTDLPLVTHEGKTVRFYTDILRDRIVLISGFYINCTTICPRQNLVLSRLQKLLEEHLGLEVFIVSISVDPDRDTPEEVKKYAKVFNAGPRWIFLTGKTENVDWVNYKLGQYTEDLDSHKGVYLLGNLKTGLWMKASPQADTQVLFKHIEQLIEDNANAKP